ncbi:MAG: hypothetical protein U5L11_09080 [Arhodomonas sp.]|nr:hypothetical protein [Arhodomonas sp.]
MGRFRARQLARIRDAVAAGRAAVRRSGSQDPVTFAEAFVAAGGVQIPGKPEAVDAAEALARRLLRALRAGQYHHAGDPDLQREVDRARQEVRWTAAQTEDSVVGFHLVVPEGAAEDATVEALAHAGRGLGPGCIQG